MTSAASSPQAVRTETSASSATASAAARTPRLGSRDVAFIAVFAALAAALSAVPGIPTGGSGVPITLQTIGIALCGMVLGPLRGFLAALLYVALGLLGLPIFSNFSGGLGVLAGGSAGYVLSFPLYALICGLLARWAVKRLTGPRLWCVLALGGLLGSFLTNHPGGILGMSINLDLTLQQALFADMAFWPGDVLKNLLAAVLAVTVHRAFPAVLVRR
ncbi:MULTISPECIES: biotin transporter BioY [Brevibacterium]|uniref:Biotin transporter n=1 Tax=Brevibacterium salitolerans TaxID=1403566 RepID=A0ABN2X651_9MICO|nr:biotin transporter BioY [Brevibacterium sp.]